MKIRAVIIDFDGTIVTEDMSDLLCELVGKKAESQRLNQLFHEGKLPGLTGLIQRINFLSGLSLDQLRQVVLENDYLRDGAEEFFQFLRDNNIFSIVASGSIVPLLEMYQPKLQADYLVGSRPKIENGRITSISAKDYSGPDFKVRDAQTILDKLHINSSEVIAIGDSPADRGIFELAAKSIAIDPKSGIENYADYVVQDDLREIISILKNLMTK